MSYINIVLQTVINILYVPILLYYVGKSEYGLYQLIGSLIAYFSVMDFGLGSTIVRFYTKYKTLNDKLNMENILAISVFAYAIISIFIFIIGIVVYFNMEYIFSDSMNKYEIGLSQDLLLLLLFNLVVSLITTIFRSVINAHEKYFILKGLETITLILQPILIVLILQNILMFL